MIQIWIYAKGFCSCLFKEDMIDADKTFDAFVCYSSEDHDFVFDHLIPALEDESPFFQLCIHERDWRAGELISEQIINSISSSRRIIIVLSQNFVNSSWAILEFQAANFQSLKDKRNRIIIIVLGELPSRDLMTSDLKLHIDMYTYLQWGERKFFDKLKFVMPRKRCTNTPNTNETSDSTLNLIQMEIIE